VFAPEGPARSRPVWIYPVLIAGSFLLFDAFAASRGLAPGVEDLGPVQVDAGQEELVLTGVPIPGEPLLQYDGVADLNLDVEADRARLDPISSTAFRQIAGQEAPSSFGKLHYFSPPVSAATAVSCRMNFKTDVQGPPREIELHVAERAPESDRLRSLQLSLRGADQRLEIEPVAPPAGPEAAAIGCQRQLEIGGLATQAPVAVTLRLLVAPSSSLTLMFGSSKPWKTLGLLDMPRLQIRSLRVDRIAGPQSRRVATRLSITAPTGDLRVNSLKLTGDRLQISVSGPGVVVSGADARSILRSLGRHPVALGLSLLALLAQVWLAVRLARALRRSIARGRRSTVFISYSHSDEVWKHRLVQHLGVLAAEGLLEIWEDRHIGLGADWRPAIEAAMDKARVAVLLISADFLTSKFIHDIEVPRLLKLRKSGLRVIPVIVHSSPWQAVQWMQQIQHWPRDGRPLSEAPEAEAEAALAALAMEIRSLLRPAGLHREQL
jgi:hypothetical protein